MKSNASKKKTKPAPSNGAVHLIIPDSHAKPGVNNDRYTWLGKYINDLRPDVVVNLGDMADMESLCSYDKGKKSYEGRRYRRDIEATHDALKKLHSEIHYKPRFVMCLGNHEARINKAVESSPELEGLISTDDLRYKEAGWEVYPFLEPVEIDGVVYCHYLPSGVMCRPIGGENAALAIIKKTLQSGTVGHSHLLDFAERTRSDGRKVMGLTAGCYFTHHENYAGPANKLYWRGVIVKRNVKNGQYDFETVSIDRLKEKYG